MEKDADGFFVNVEAGVSAQFPDENHVLHLSSADAPKPEAKVESAKPTGESSGE
jgi:hypothetical protein